MLCFEEDAAMKTQRAFKKATRILRMVFVAQSRASLEFRTKRECELIAKQQKEQFMALNTSSPKPEEQTTSYAVAQKPPHKAKHRLAAIFRKEPTNRSSADIRRVQCRNQV